jgi:hypothetical protein
VVIMPHAEDYEPCDADFIQLEKGKAVLCSRELSLMKVFDGGR